MILKTEHVFLVVTDVSDRPIAPRSFATLRWINVNGPMYLTSIFWNCCSLLFEIIYLSNMTTNIFVYHTKQLWSLEFSSTIFVFGQITKCDKQQAIFVSWSMVIWRHSRVLFFLIFYCVQKLIVDKFRKVFVPKQIDETL